MSELCLSTFASLRTLQFYLLTQITNSNDGFETCQTAELIQREEALRETSQKLQAIVQASPAAILEPDPEGRVKTWNPAAEKTFGWCEAEVLDRPLPIVPNDKQDEFHSLLQQVLQGEALTQVEVHRQKRNGIGIDISISTAPLQTLFLYTI